MSTDKWGDWLFFGGDMPSIVADMPEVPKPKGVGIDSCGFRFGKFIHWDGCTCDWEYEQRRDDDMRAEQEAIERDPPDPSW